jgi:hypothetical protein
MVSRKVDDDIPLDQIDEIARVKAVYRVNQHVPVPINLGKKRLRISKRAGQEISSKQVFKQSLGFDRKNAG